MDQSTATPTLAHLNAPDCPLAIIGLGYVGLPLEVEFGKHRPVVGSIRRELPEIIRTDPDFLRYILDLTRREYAGRAATEDRFYELLAELRRDREESARKWDAHQAEQREEFKRVHEEIMAQAQRHDRSIGALGSAIGE
jgi:hypothetical protein